MLNHPLSIFKYFRAISSCSSVSHAVAQVLPHKPEPESLWSRPRCLRRY